MQPCPTLFLTIVTNICQIRLLSLHFLPILKVPLPFLSFTKQINLCGTNYGPSRKVTKPLCFSKSQCVYETFENVAPILHSVIYSEMNVASIINKRLLSMKSGSHKFRFSLECFYGQKILQLIYNYIILYVVFSVF